MTTNRKQTYIFFGLTNSPTCTSRFALSRDITVTPAPGSHAFCLSPHLLGNTFPRLFRGCRPRGRGGGGGGGSRGVGWVSWTHTCLPTPHSPRAQILTPLMNMYVLIVLVIGYTGLWLLPDGVSRVRHHVARADTDAYTPRGRGAVPLTPHIHPVCIPILIPGVTYIPLRYRCGSRGRCGRGVGGRRGEHMICRYYSDI